MPISIAPFWLWAAFSAGIICLLFLDLGIFGRRPHVISKKSALMESIMWITIALCFNFWFALHYGHELGIEFLTGYLVEKSLSVDNLFVILLIFQALHVEAKYQHRVLFYGVLGAIVFRAAFIIVGAHLLQKFHWILFVMGGVLIITAIKLLQNPDEAEQAENKILVFLRKHLPVSAIDSGQKFFVKESNRRKVTTLFVALVAIEITDIVFAVDSIPAVFAVTKDAFVAFASNILAVLGLRALFFILSDLLTKLTYLKQALAFILGFVGVKMIIAEWVLIPSWVSLVVIALSLGIATIASIQRAKTHLTKHGT